MGIIQAYQNWERKKALKNDWRAALKKIRFMGPAAGIDLPVGDVVAAAAAMEMLKENPQLTVVRYRDNFTLTWRPEVIAALSQAGVEVLQKQNMLASPADDLVEDTVAMEDAVKADRARNDV